MLLELLLMLTPIDGTKYNTRALQQANFANIQARGGTLYGEYKSAPLKPAPKPLPLLPAQKSKVYLQPVIKDPKYLPETATSKNTPYYDTKLKGNGIQLNGSFTPEHQKIADKYKNYFDKPVSINMIKGDAAAGTQYAGQSVGGLNTAYSDGSRKVTISNDLKDDSFEITLLHEIAHSIYHFDEDTAWIYAQRMMNIINKK